jgi:hypothetical protein
MCCSSGVCGPRVDPVLVRFAADLKWLEEQEVTVERYSLAQAPGAFARQPVVAEHMRRSFTACLPILLIDGSLAFKGRYPTREQLVLGRE